MCVLFSIVSTLWLASAYAVGASATPDPKSYAGKDEMNGIRFAEHVGFEKDWHYVTTRFRKDTGELRITYANEAAWKTLVSGSIEYPQGAAFAKIGIATKEDPSFASSAVPSGARRVQFMVRDVKKYESTTGWGYALFDADGKTYPENPVSSAQACSACHQIVPERGYVFSVPLTISSFPGIGLAPGQAKPGGEGVKFVDVKRKDLPTDVRKLISANEDNARMIEGTLRDHLFQGTLDEIRPTLAKEYARTKQASLLLSRDKTRYSIVVPTTKIKCDGQKIALHGVHNMSFEQGKVYEIDFCADGI